MKPRSMSLQWRAGHFQLSNTVLRVIKEDSDPNQSDVPVHLAKVIDRRRQICLKSPIYAHFITIWVYCIKVESFLQSFSVVMVY